MARTNTIPENLLPKIMDMYHNGSNAQDVVDMLKAEHDITISTRGVGRRINGILKIEQDAKKAAIAERAAKNAVDCLEIIDNGIEIINREAMKLIMSDNIADKSVGKQLADTALKYIDKKMNLTGMDKQEITENDEELLQGLLRKLGE